MKNATRNLISRPLIVILIGLASPAFPVNPQGIAFEPILDTNTFATCP